MRIKIRVSTPKYFWSQFSDYLREDEEIRKAFENFRGFFFAHIKG